MSLSIQDVLFDVFLPLSRGSDPKVSGHIDSFARFPNRQPTHLVNPCTVLRAPEGPALARARLYCDRITHTYAAASPLGHLGAMASGLTEEEREHLLRTLAEAAAAGTSLPDIWAQQMAAAADARQVGDLPSYSSCQFYDFYRVLHDVELWIGAVETTGLALLLLHHLCLHCTSNAEASCHCCSTSHTGRQHGARLVAVNLLVYCIIRSMRRRLVQECPFVHLAPHIPLGLVCGWAYRLRKTSWQRRLLTREANLLAVFATAVRATGWCRL